MPDKEQSPSVTELEIGEAICWLRLLATRFEDEWPTTANAARHHAARIEALHAEREKLRERMRLIEFDATNKNSAPSARLQRIADYARTALSGKDSPDAP
jgi:hypothetical protein